MKRAAYAVGAVACMVAALLILDAAGLPQRAAFTGEIRLDQPPVAPEIDAIAPDFELTNSQGDTIRLSDYRGQTVVLNFWATWCGPCALEMPILQSIFSSQHAAVLAVNLGETPGTIHTWQQEQELTYDLLVDEQQQVAALYRLRGQPSTYVISPDGIIKTIFFGPVSEQALLTALNA
jgi:peroxiredoxin